MGQRYCFNYTNRIISLENVQDGTTVGHIVNALLPNAYPDYFKNKSIFLKQKVTGEKLHNLKKAYDIRTMGDEVQWHMGVPLLYIEVGPEKSSLRCTVQ